MLSPLRGYSMAFSQIGNRTLLQIAEVLLIFSLIFFLDPEPLFMTESLPPTPAEITPPSTHEADGQPMASPPRSRASSGCSIR